MSVDLNENFLKRRSGNFELTAIFTLSLHNCGLTELKPILSACSNLFDLDISNNKLDSLNSIDGRRLSKLSRLNVSMNLVSSLNSLTFLPSLTELFLQGNKIESIENLSILSSKTPSLRSLSLQQSDGSLQNSVCSSPGYRSQILALLPGLEILDGIPVRSAGEREFSLALSESDSQLTAQIAAFRRLVDSQTRSAAAIAEKIEEKKSEKWTEKFSQLIKENQENFTSGESKKEIQAKISLVRHSIAELKKIESENEKIENSREKILKTDNEEVEDDDEDNRIEYSPRESYSESTASGNQSPSVVSREISKPGNSKSRKIKPKK